jgi:hypothetical protein
MEFEKEVIKESYAFIEPIIRELEKESDDGRMTESVAESKYKEGCTKCALLLELYERTPQAPRDYWVMTELFDILHGGDVCTGDRLSSLQEVFSSSRLEA